jgi:uncharacterized membrane protein YfcA
MPGFDEINLTVVLLLLGIVLFAGMVHGTLGLGFPMIATPLIAMLTDVLNAMLIVLVPTLAVNLVSIVRGGDWQKSITRFWPLAAYGAVGSMLGTQLLILTDPKPYKLLLAAVILLYLNVNRFGFRMPWVKQRPALAFAVFGLTGGLLAGTVNVMVPALIVFALEAGLKPTATVQVFNFCFLFGKLSQATVFVASGVFTVQTLLTTLPIAGITLLALIGGMLLYRRIDPATYRGWMRGVLFVIALVLIGQFGYSVI